MSEREDHDPRDPGVLLGREFAAAVVLFHEAVGQRLGVSATERKVLDVLDRVGPATAGELAEHTGLTTGAITGIVDRLSKAGYVRREPNPRDRRSVIVRLLPHPERERLVPEVFAPLGREIAALSTRYTDQELAAIADYLSRLTVVLREQTARLQAEPPRR